MTDKRIQGAFHKIHGARYCNLEVQNNHDEPAGFANSYEKICRQRFAKAQTLSGRQHRYRTAPAVTVGRRKIRQPASAHRNTNFANRPQGFTEPQRDREMPVLRVLAVTPVTPVDVLRRTQTIAGPMPS